ncbi:MFS transporter [Salinibacterium sp. ZJ70]|uniref:MFS transporter n=1 Tax=Salinibacterium sp. ZJ70 TaxID=2708084 RepID=UPI001421C70C|nr:MFS transporter [Salinibacterium sp. ZJ70]
MTSRHRELLSIATLAGAGMLTSFQFTLTVPALPEIPSALDVSATDAAWVVTISMLAGTIGTPIVARMADMYGRRRIFIACLAILTLGSMLAAIGMTYTTVMIGRACQGFATSLVPIGISIMREQLSRERSSSAIAAMSATIGIGSTIGLPLAGILLEAGGIPAIFWFSAILGAVFLILVPLFVTPSRIRSGGRFDLVGASILAVCLAAFLLVVSKGLEWGWASTPTLLFASIAVLAFAIWIPHQLRTPDPVVNLRTSMRRGVMQTNIAAFFASVGMFANHFLTLNQARAPESTGSGLGLEATQAGLLLMPSAFMLVVLSPVVGKALGRYGGRIPLALGAAIMSAGFWIRLWTEPSVGSIVLCTFLVGVGTAFAFAATPTLILDSVPAHEAAAASGVNGLIRSLSAAMTSSAFALLMTAYPWHGNAEYLTSEGLDVGFITVGIAAALAAAIAVALPKVRPTSPARG